MQKCPCRIRCDEEILVDLIQFADLNIAGDQDGNFDNTGKGAASRR